MPEHNYSENNYCENNYCMNLPSFGTKLLRAHLEELAKSQVFECTLCKRRVIEICRMCRRCPQECHPRCMGHRHILGVPLAPIKPAAAPTSSGPTSSAPTPSRVWPPTSPAEVDDSNDPYGDPEWNPFWGYFEL
jgi:hypothetical protein